MSDITVAISTFGRPATVLQTVSNLHGVPALVNVNDGDADLARNLRGHGFRVIQTEAPELFWQGMVTLVRHSLTDWILLTSDEDSVIVEELPALQAFAEQRNAGVVCAPVWDGSLLKPWPKSWADRLNDDSPLHPRHFHDISGYISGTLLHRETALKHIAVIEDLAPENHYVLIYTVPALVALMGMTRDAYVYPRPVTKFGQQLPGQQEVPGSNYWEQDSRRIQREHFDSFLNVIRGKNPGYAELLDESRVYESRRWA